MNPLSETSSLDSLLKELGNYVTPTKEPTLFAVGGCGYYENPASDLLAFFLKPDAEHRLGDLFPSTFLECIGKDRPQLNMSNVCVGREVPTNDSSRIDLQILGPDWCLQIENKIYHWQANPFGSYALHAKALRKHTMFSILSPDGHSEAEGWIGVSYKKYCSALRERMAAILFDSPFSKWQLFAREFILHLENELYNSPMTTEQAKFVEKHAVQFMQAQQLLQQYSDFLCVVLKQRLENELRYEVKISAANWGILITSPERWRNAYIAFRPPTLDGNGRFHISIYPVEGELKEGQTTASQTDLLANMEYTQNRFWWTKPNEGFKDRETAINDLIPRIELIERHIPNVSTK